MSSNNQTAVKDVDFTEDDVILVEPIGNDLVYHFIGEFDGATIYVEECGIHWFAAGFDKGPVGRDQWLADTTTTGLWTAVSINGTAIELTGPSGSNYIDTPKRYVRFRCDGAGADTDILGQVTFFKP